jgi:putative N6-adenine-specific DNA methylase
MSAPESPRKKTGGRLQVFLSCAPGLEPLLEREVAELAGEARAIPGGVELACDRETLARLLVEVGLASHALVRVAQFPVRELAELEAHVARLPWSGWLRRDVPRRVRAHAQRSRLYHTGAIEERVFRAITTRLGDAPAEAPAEESVPLTVRMVDDRCTISLDVGGTPLHRRGYRLDPHRAPLREDLARAVILASGWDGSGPLVDPTCGSGTLVIEAAMLATRRAPGLERRFAVERTALDDGEALARARDAARARIREAPAPLLGRDRDARAIEASRANAERAGVGASIRFEVGPLSTTADALRAAGVEGGVTVVSNPPWGERLGEASDLRPLYGAIGSLVRSLPSSTLTMVAHDRKLAYATGVPLESAFLTDLGGIKATVMRTRVEASTERARERDASETP